MTRCETRPSTRKEGQLEAFDVALLDHDQAADDGPMADAFKDTDHGKKQAEIEAAYRQRGRPVRMGDSFDDGDVA
jgi:hypothetical protein